VNWTRYFTLLFDGIENVSLDLENEDFKIYVNDIEDLIKVTDFFSELNNIQLTLAAVVFIKKYETKNHLPDLRNVSCVHFVRARMPEPCNYLLTDPKVFSETKIQVKQILTGIKSAFRSMVESVDWLDNEAKQATLQKVDNIQDIIGVPEWMLNREELDRRSSKVRWINNTKNS
ncbi:hypothetical protein C0J52_24912, partial [Blattella germanica]